MGSWHKQYTFDLFKEPDCVPDLAGDVPDPWYAVRRKDADVAREVPCKTSFVPCRGTPRGPS